MENISDVYCKKCKNYSFACDGCIVSEDGWNLYSPPSKFEPKKTTKIPYEKLYNHNMNWISAFADIAGDEARTRGYDPSNVKIEKVIFSGPATIVLWQGGGKTIVKYHKEKGCTYRKDLGVLYCIIKHYMCLDNTKLFHKLLKTIDEFCEAEKWR